MESSKLKETEAMCLIGEQQLQLKKLTESEEKFRKWWLEERKENESLRKELKDWIEPKSEKLLKNVILKLCDDVISDDALKKKTVSMLLESVPKDILEAYILSDTVYLNKQL